MYSFAFFRASFDIPAFEMLSSNCESSSPSSLISPRSKLEMLAGTGSWEQQHSTNAQANRQTSPTANTLLEQQQTAWLARYQRDDWAQRNKSRF